MAPWLALGLGWSVPSIAAEVLYEYDQLGRLTTVTYPNGAQVIYSYDPAGNRTSQVTTLTNVPPDAVDDSYGTVQDVPLSVPAGTGVLANDSDPNDDPLTVSASDSSSVAGGTVAVATDGSFVYTPPPGFVGSDSFGYTASDGQGGSEGATVTVAVGAVANQPPVAIDDGYGTAEDVPLSVPAGTGVLGNDSDPDNDPLTVSASDSTSTAGGTVAVAADGSFVYTPPSSFVGSDSFGYTASDGQGGSDSATVTVTVSAAPNQPPVAVNDSYGTVEDVQLSVPAGTGVLVNDSDPDDDPLTVSASDSTSTAGGTVAVAADGSFVYTPPAGFVGSDSFGYTASDGEGGSDSATVTVTVSAANQPPVAQADALSTFEDRVLAGNVLLGNGSGLDSDPNGDALTVSAVNGEPGAVGSQVTLASGALLTVGANGALSYDPNGQFDALNAGETATDSFTYEISDGNGGTDSATVTITVRGFAPLPPDSPPSLLSALDGSNGFRLDGVAANDNSGLSVRDAGDINGDGFGDVIVGAYGADPNGSTSGSSYVVFGTAGGFPSALDLGALDGSNGFRLDGVAAGDLSGYSVSDAGDVNGDSFDDVIIGAYGADPNGSGSGSSYVVFGKPGGFSPALDLGSLDGTMGFRLDGAAGDTSGLSVSRAGDVNGDGFDDVIVGAYQADLNGFASGSSYVVFGKANGFPAALSLGTLDGTTGFRLDGAAASDFSGHAVSAVGDVNGDGFDDVIVGAYAADPNGSASGSSYVVFGKAGGFSAALNLGSLDGTNGFRLDGMATGDQSGNAVSAAGDVNGDGYDDVIVGAYLADLNGSGSGSSYVVFGHAGGFSPALSLSSLDGTTGFRLDGEAAGHQSGIAVSAAGDVNRDGYGDVIIGAQYADPGGTANAGSSYVVFGRSGAFPATTSLGSLSSTDGLRLDGAAAEDGSGASVSAASDVNGDGYDDVLIGAYQADPNGSASGASYVVFGGNFNSTPNGPPVAANDSYATVEDVELSVPAGTGVLANDSDPDDDPLAVSASDSTSTAGGTVAVAADGSVVYTPPSGFVGSDSFGYTASDGQGGTDGATVTVTVSAANQTPVAANDSYETQQGVELVVMPGIGLLANDSDPDQDPLTVSASDSTSTAGGTVAVASDGSFTYAPPSGFVGADSFGYTAIDGRGGSDSATVTVTVSAPPNQPPVAQGDALFTFEDRVLAGNVLFGNGSGLDSDADGDPLTVSAVNGLPGSVGNQVTLASGALLTVGSSGALSYDPNGQFDALNTGDTATDSFIYEISDGNGGTDTATVTITIKGFAPLPPASPPSLLSALDGSTGFRLDGAAADDNSGVSVANAGDINGDGFSDVLVGAYRADPNGSNSGSSYVVFGKASGFSATIDLSSLDGTTGFRLDGAVAEDFSGFSVSTAGDVNSDGFDDVFVAAYEASPSGPDSGSSYLVFGQAGGFPAVVNLSSLDGTTGFRLDGLGANDNSGSSVSGAGDMNGDGYGDLIIGTPRRDQAGGFDFGSSYVVLGKAGGFPAMVNLSSLDGTTGFSLDGASSHDFSGASVSGAGDVNGDGFADVIIGAQNADHNEFASGSSYVVFGKASGFFATINLGSLDGMTGFRLDGAAYGDFSGTSVSGAGDVNGDGFDDVIVGAPQADPNGSNSGASYIVFGKASGFAAALDLDALDGSNGFRVDGAAAEDFSGYSVRAAGDVNRDGYGDIIIGSPWADPGGTTNAGSSYIVFGRGAAFPATMSLASLSSADGLRLDGAAAEDGSGASVSAASDVNGDGYDDMLIGANGADPNGAYSGSSFVVFGGNFGGGGVPNSPPVALDDSYETQQDAQLSVPPGTGVLANDSDPDEDLLTVSASDSTSTAGGSVTVAADGGFVYTPPSGFVGADSFGYTASDGQGGTDSATTTVTVSAASGGEEFHLGSGNDDAEEAESAAVFLDSSDLELVFDSFQGAGDQTVGVRFPNVDVPQGATISSAHLQLTVDETTSAATDLTLRGEAIGDAEAFTAATGNISSRVRTDSAASWSVAPWNSVGEAGTAQRSPDLSAIVQEIVDQPSWAPGNALSLIITGSGQRIAESYEGAPTDSAVLIVDYSTGANVAPIARNDAYFAVQNTVLSVSAAQGVLANDTDANQDSLFVGWANTTTWMGGTISISADGSFSYTPPSLFTGFDAINFGVSDGQGGDASGFATFIVNSGPPGSGNHPPFAWNDLYSTVQDTPLNVTPREGVLANDADPDGDPLIIMTYDTTTANGGTVSMNVEGGFVYTPPAGFTGYDSFDYEVRDDSWWSWVGGVTVQVE